MIIPYSIPSWIKVKKNAKEKNVDINFSVNPLTGKHTGHLFYKGEVFPFQLEIYPKNMVLSLKRNVPELFSTWEHSVEQEFRILYRADTEYPFHAEWYYEVEEELITQELNRMKNAINIEVLELK